MKTSFFASTGLQMEDGLADEIREVWPWLLDLDGRNHSEPLPELMIDKGGVAFQAPLHLGLQLNFQLKTAHRILLRLAEFRCRDLPKLFQRAQKIYWREWLGTEDVRLEVAASQSRLNNEKRIISTLTEAWKLKDAEKSLAQESIYVRVFDDTVTVSLDTSGEHLHFRGGQKHIGEAPLRETLAAFCLRSLIGITPWAELKEVELIDPMMGSGTFLSEALSINRVVPRTYAFQKWPRTPAALRGGDFQKAWKAKKIWRALRGTDIDAQVVSIAERNLCNQIGDPRPVVSLGDVFKMPPIEKEKAEQTWLILNPPYGERLAWNHQPQELLEALAKTGATRIGILWSEQQANQAETPNTLRHEASYRLQNGGLRVKFQVYHSNIG